MNGTYKNAILSGPLIPTTSGKVKVQVTALMEKILDYIVTTHGEKELVILIMNMKIIGITSILH